MEYFRVNTCKKLIKQNKKKGLQGIPFHQLHNSGKVGIERTKFMNPVRSSGYKIINKEIIWQKKY